MDDIEPLATDKIIERLLHLFAEDLAEMTPSGEQEPVLLYPVDDARPPAINEDDMLAFFTYTRPEQLLVLRGPKAQYRHLMTFEKLQKEWSVPLGPTKVEWRRKRRV
jgi:hypothetical protein